MSEQPFVGTIIANRYRVLKKMGEGGMGTVYFAEHVTIAKKVALKVLLPEYARKKDLRDRFLREARAAASIGHENIVDITDFGDTPDGSVFFAMEFLEGVDLAGFIKQQGAVPWQMAQPILLQICRGLSAAHAANIIHRDMKPENIYLVDRPGRSQLVKVLDFGIAKVSDEGDGNKRLTRTGMIFGTPEYMSPEQARGHHPDHRVDIYAIGVIMYEMLSGDVPFKADTFMGILTKHLFEEPLPLHQANEGADIPPAVEKIVSKAMCKDREGRYQSVAEIITAIRAVALKLSGSVSGTHAPPAAETSHLHTGGDGNKSSHFPRDEKQSSAAPLRAKTTFPTGGVELLEGVRQKRGGTIGFVIAAALVLLLGGGLFKILSPDEHAPAPQRLVAADKGIPPSHPTLADDHAAEVRLLIRSAPEGARIRFDPPRAKEPSDLGVTPRTLSVKQSTDPLWIIFEKKGYQPLRLSVIPERDNIVLNAPLVANRRIKRRSRPKRPATRISKKRHLRPRATQAAKVRAKETTKRRPHDKSSAAQVEDIIDPF